MGTEVLFKGKKIIPIVECAKLMRGENIVVVEVRQLDDGAVVEFKSFNLRDDNKVFMLYFTSLDEFVLSYCRPTDHPSAHIKKLEAQKEIFKLMVDMGFWC